MVRRGYDAVSLRYRGDNDLSGNYVRWLAALLARLAPTSRVADLGCGCGVPMARAMVQAGHRVTGVDMSEVQTDRARQLVPGGSFIRADLSEVAFPDASFDAVVFIYAIIHMPLEEQLPLLRRVGCWLQPGGWLLLTAGHRAWTGQEDNWLGWGAPMWWSHADAATYRAWLDDAGFEVVEEGFLPEGSGGHSEFWARKKCP